MLGYKDSSCFDEDIFNVLEKRSNINEERITIRLVSLLKAINLRQLNEV